LCALRYFRLPAACEANIGCRRSAPRQTFFGWHFAEATETEGEFHDRIDHHHTPARIAGIA
jgi:hypothetical protein